VHQHLEDNLETTNLAGELKALHCQRGPMFRAGKIKWSLLFIADVEP
jgi:hypothetical protein